MAGGGFELRIFFSGLNMFVPVDTDGAQTSLKKAQACTVLLFDARGCDHEVHGHKICQHAPYLWTEPSGGVKLDREEVELLLPDGGTWQPLSFSKRPKGARGDIPVNAEDAAAWDWVTSVGAATGARRRVLGFWLNGKGHDYSSLVAARIKLPGGQLSTYRLVTWKYEEMPVQVSFQSRAEGPRFTRAAALSMCLVATVENADKLEVRLTSFGDGHWDKQRSQFLSPKQEHGKDVINLRVTNDPPPVDDPSNWSEYGYHYGLLARLLEPLVWPPRRYPYAWAQKNLSKGQHQPTDDDATGKPGLPRMPEAWKKPQPIEGNHPICPGGGP